MIAFIDDHRRGAWGRADLQGAADRPVDLPRPCRQARRSLSAVGSGTTGCSLERRDPARVRGELPRLWRAQSLAAIAAGRLRCRALHGRPADEGHGPSRAHSRQTAPHDGERQGRTLSAGSCESPVQCSGAEPAVARRFHLRRDLGGLRLCRLCHRHLCAKDRRLASKQDGACELRPGRSRTGAPRSAADPSRRARAPQR